MEKRKDTTIRFLILGITLIFLLILNLSVGSVKVPIKEIIAILMNHTKDTSAGVIILSIRLPRICAALLMGGALSVSGFLLQTFFHNPIAGPYILGVSSGSKLFVALSMILAMNLGSYLHSTSLIASAFLGAAVSMGFILAISTRLHHKEILIICGVMIGYICSAVTDFLVTFADDANIVNLHNWSLGSFSGMNWSNVYVMTPVIFLGVLLAFLLSKPMSAYQLGETYAQNLGVNIRRFRICLIFLSCFLAAVVTAYAGPISFVGVAVPHLIKLIFKSQKPIIMIPGCFLGGSVFCLLSDFIARTAFAPTELSISSVTAVFGAPVVLFMMIKRRGLTDAK